jgi:sec-independent protein translocase protein TatB
MFDIFSSHMLIVALVAIVLIGPKDLPRVMRVVGQWVGRGRSMARQFRSAMDEMIRESELQEMEKKWKAENERIMREHADLISGTQAPYTGQPQDDAAALPAPEAAHPAEPAQAAPIASHHEAAAPEKPADEPPPPVRQP